jgi:hypothetical protein
MTHPKAGGKPSFVEEFEYREALDPERRKSYDSYAEQRKFNPWAAPLSLGPNDTYEPGGAQEGGEEAIAEDANGNRIRYNPQSGQWEPMGGPTAGPSAVFQQ